MHSHSMHVQNEVREQYVQMHIHAMIRCKRICCCGLHLQTLTQQRREVKPRIESHDNHVTVQAGTNGEGDGCERREGGHSDKQEEEEEGREEGKEEEEGKGEREEADLTSEVVRKFQQQLEEIKVAPREARRRKSRRLEQKEPEPVAPSLPPPRTRPSPALPSYRRSRRNRKKSEPLTDSQISDSQVLQVHSPPAHQCLCDYLLCR